MTDEQQDWVSEFSVGNPVLDATIKSNAMRVQQLAQRNWGIDITRAKVQHLLSVLFPEFPDRQAYEGSFQAYLSQQISGVEDMAAAKDAAEAIEIPQQSLFVPGQ